MSSSFATRAPVRADTIDHAGFRHALAAIAREVNEAFEALARRRYDAPWQRIATPRDTCR